MNTTDNHDEPDRGRGAWLLILGLCVMACGYITIGQATNLQGVTTPLQDSSIEAIDRIQKAGGLTMVFGLFIAVIGLADLIAPTREETSRTWAVLATRSHKNSTS